MFPWRTELELRLADETLRCVEERTGRRVLFRRDVVVGGIDVNVPKGEPVVVERNRLVHHRNLLDRRRYMRKKIIKITGNELIIRGRVASCS